MADRMVVRTEGRSVGHSVDPKVGLMEDHSVDQTEDRLAGRSVGQMAVRTVDHSVDRSVDRSVDLKEGHLVDLLEVRVVLHRFAQLVLVLVLVQARLQVLRALVVLDLEWVFV